MTALGEAVISGCAFGGRPTTPASHGRLFFVDAIPGVTKVVSSEPMNTGI